MGYTNLFDPSKATLNARISSSGTPSWYGMYFSDFIPVDGIERGSDVFRILNAHGNGTGPTFGAADNGGGQYVAYYDAAKTLRLREGLGGTSATSATVPVVGAEDGAFLHPLTSTSNGANMNGSEVAYVRFCLSTMKAAGTWDGGGEISAEDVSEVAITLNEPISGEASGGGGVSVIASAQITVSLVAEVDSVWRYYLLQESTLSAPQKPGARPPAGWSDAEPAYQDGSTNSLYTVDLTVFSDGSWAYSEPSLSSSYEAAKAAYNEAKAAMGAAESAAKTATDYIAATDEGVVVGDMRGEELGFNSLQGADGFHIRYKGAALASWLANALYLGRNSDDALIYLVGNGRGRIKYEPIEARVDGNIRAALKMETPLFADGGAALLLESADILEAVAMQGAFYGSATSWERDDCGYNYYSGLKVNEDGTTEVSGRNVSINLHDGFLEGLSIRANVPFRVYMCGAYCSADLALGTGYKRIKLGNLLAQTDFEAGLLYHDADAGGIVCHKAGTVEVTGTVYVENITAGDNISVRFYKNNTDYIGGRTSPAKTTGSAHLPTRTFSVAEGDTIYLSAANLTAARGNVAGGSSATCMYVKYLD